jgi:integrase
VQHRFAVLRVTLSAALLADRIGRSPCRGIKLPRAEPIRGRLPDVTELLALIEATRPEYAPMVWIGAVLGLRWGEVAGLRVGSIDFLRGHLVVTETVGEASGVIHTGPPKSTASRRQLPVPATLVDVLAEHLAKTGLTATDSDRYLFPAPMGGPRGHPHDGGLYAQAGTDAKQRANDAVAALFLGSAERQSLGRVSNFPRDNCAMEGGRAPSRSRNIRPDQPRR